MKQYQDLLRDVLENGNRRGDRTGTGTISIFGRQTRFDLQKGFPIVTTKRVPFKSLVAELLWFLKGSTDNNELNQMGSTIWNEWALEDGSLGPIYGKQWRAWEGANGQTYDQIKEAIHTLKTRPYSRRIIVSAWNVADLPDETKKPQQNVVDGKMSLAPCHCFFQFYVEDMPEGSEQLQKLSCQMYIRSNDAFLGCPFNIASYALLVHLMAHECHMAVGELVYTTGDFHIYSNHIDQVHELLSREPKPLPRLIINPFVNSIFDFKVEDIVLEGYDPHPAIKADVAV